jgi:hypothetical protein
MKLDHQLQRLLDAAAKSSAKAADAAPLGLETRIIAQWRAAATDDETAFLFAFFRRAMLCATMVLLFSAAWSFSRMSHEVSADEAILDNYDVQLSLNP